MDVCWRNLCRLKASDFISMTSIFSQQKKRKVQTQLKAFICNLDEHTIRCIRGDESPLLRPPSWRVRKRFCMFVVSLIHSDFIHSSVVSQSVCLEDNNIRETLAGQKQRLPSVVFIVVLFLPLLHLLSPVSFERRRTAGVKHAEPTAASSGECMKDGQREITWKLPVPRARNLLRRFHTS